MADDGVNSTREARQVSVLGYCFSDCSLDIAARIVVDLAQSDARHEVFFVNAHCVNVAARDNEYAQQLMDAPLLFADGAGMALAARIQGERLRNNVNGTDLFPVICERAAREGVPIALLGAKPGVAEACAEKMQFRFPGLQVAHVAHGYLSAREEDDDLSVLNNSGARILFVAKGVPMQEHWIERHRGILTAPVVLGVGALFDFYSGTIPRAPEMWRKLKMEWVYRLLQEPRRMFRRYLIGNPEFVLRVVWKRLSGNG